MSSPRVSGGGGSIVFLKHIHMSLVFLELSCILFMAAQSFTAFNASWILLLPSFWTISYWVQSSAYLHELTSMCAGSEFSRSFICTLNSVGEITDPCGTPARHNTGLDFTPPKLTCWLLPSRKLFVHNQKLLFTLSSASFLKRIPWSTKSKALRKSRNTTCTPDLPSFELSVALNQFWDKSDNADTVDRFSVKSCWVLLIRISDLFKSSWCFSISLAIWGRIDTCRKSLSISLGQFTFGIG